MQSIATDLLLNVKYFYHDFWKARNEIVDSFPLLQGGPWPVLLITSGYIWFSTVLGPKFMKNRDAFDLRPLLISYNLLMVLINGFIFYKATIFTNFGIYPWRCSSWGESADETAIKEMLELSWLFFFSKFLDFLDTVFFVLRKKDQQLSRLHLIHHSLMPICTFFGMKFWSNMSAGLVPFINSFVHTLMYTYYALAAMKVRVWWKKYLTQLQMGQLMLVAFHSFYFSMLSSCDLYPSYFAYPIGFLSLMLLGLFTNFFYQAYIKNSRTTTSENFKISNGNAFGTIENLSKNTQLSTTSEKSTKQNFLFQHHSDVLRASLKKAN